MTATYYQPSGRVSPLGLIAALLVGGISALVLAVLYAAALVYNPSAYLGILLPVLYGAAVGAITALVGKRLKVRNSLVLTALALALTIGGYALSWIPWEWFTLYHLGSEVDVIAVLFPPSFLEILMLLYENGAWTIGSSGGAVSGVMLGLVWLMEAGLVLGTSALTAHSLASSGVFCETCEEWCQKLGDLFHHHFDAQPTIVQALGNYDLSILTSAPRADPSAGVWTETELAFCNCGATNTLLVQECARRVDRRGNASVNKKPVVKHLVLTKQQMEWVRRTAGR